MKLPNLSGAAFLSLCLLLPMCVQAQQPPTSGAGPYTRLQLGPSIQEDGQITRFGTPVSRELRYDVGFAAQVAVGYAFNQYLATEFEFGGIGSRVRSAAGYFSDDTFIDNIPFGLNVMLSYPISRIHLVPYLGAGAGGSVTIFSTDFLGNDTEGWLSGDESDLVFAWKAFAGLRYEINNKMAVGLGYKYFETQDTSFDFPTFPPGPDFELKIKGVKAHLVEISFRMKF